MNSLVTRRSPWMFPSLHYLFGLNFDFLRGVFLDLPAKWDLNSVTQHTVARLAGSGSSSQSFIAFLKATVQIGDSEGTISSQGRARLLSCLIPLSPHCPVRGLSHSRFLIEGIVMGCSFSTASHIQLGGCQPCPSYFSSLLPCPSRLALNFCSSCFY